MINLKEKLRNIKFLRYLYAKLLSHGNSFKFQGNNNICDTKGAILKQCSVEINGNNNVILIEIGSSLEGVKIFMRGENLKLHIGRSVFIGIYGRSDSWKQFRHFPQLYKVGKPDNYRGDLPNSFQESSLMFMSNYKVCVCLENSCEPYYFTEKFVNAVRAGCIPIYHAHFTIREQFLKDALWVDPANFNFNVEDTINYALKQDLAHYRQINDNWLTSNNFLATTTTDAFWERITTLMEEKLIATS